MHIPGDRGRPKQTAFEAEFGSLLDPRESTVSPRVFSDPALYQLESERVFGRCWLYVGHETQISEPNSFVIGYMGEESVIVTRGRSGKIKVFLNSCRHRGMRLCHVDNGIARTFQCPYHGWTFSNEGKLVGIPDFEAAHHGALDAEKWGLIEVSRVETYRGLIFACHDKDAATLSDYLGNAKWYLDVSFDRTVGGLRPLPGIAKTKWPANWKLGAEQFCGDNAHGAWAHSFLFKLGLAKEFGGSAAWTHDFQVKCDNGHGMIMLSEDPSHIPPTLQTFRSRMREEAAKRLLPAQVELVDLVHVGTIFPNFSFLEFMGSLFIRTWHPRGVNNTEMWTWMMSQVDAPAEVTELQRDLATRNFGPAGMIESDDSEMWTGCAETTGGFLRKRYPLNYSMSQGHGITDPDRPGLIHRTPTELACFGFHQRWNDLMQRESLA